MFTCLIDNYNLVTMSFHAAKLDVVYAANLRS